MKTFQILENLCHWDATQQFQTVEDTIGKFAPNIVFVSAPDFIFEGWGCDEGQTGDERFIKPTAPEGWKYDDATGTFYPDEIGGNEQ